ncbi:MAG: hypothetical protein HQ542_01990 [Bacteroidia bacterium]|nr:hypothetical protein [Bacteroidia bacterium]
MFLKKNFLWILFFGTLIGLNETLIGSFNIPYRSVILSSITLTLLSIVRYQLPKTGTSILIILIAILFKINSIGFHSCTTNVFLCGPTALLLLGIGYEVFAFLFIAKNTFKYLNYILTCVITSVVAFSIFALMNTYLLNVWDTVRLSEYIFVRALLTAILSSAISLVGLYLARTFKNENFARVNPYIINTMLSCVIIALWLFGSHHAKF